MPTQPPLSERIAKKLARGVPARDVIPEVCDTTGMDWEEAEKYVAEIARFRKKSISSQRFPVLVLISLGTAFIGLTILAYTVVSMQADLAEALASLAGTAAPQAALNFFLHFQVFGQLLVGIGMLIGGMIGVGRAIYDRALDN
jgi:uncharacterized membrane protein